MDTLKQFRQVSLDYISDRRLIPLLVAWTILAVFDITNRLAPPKQTETTRAYEGRQEKVSVQRLNPKRYQMYVDKLDGLSGKSNYSGGKSDSSALEFESTTPPEANEIPVDKGFWSAEKSSYRLVAVLRGDDLFAVLERIEHGTAKRTRIKMHSGDQTDEFRVTDIKMGSITIESQHDGEIMLRMFEGKDRG